MNIGKDAMGTMANTLILAFAGSSLNTLLLVRVYDIPFAQLINTDFICVEILQSVAGSMGILFDSSPGDRRERQAHDGGPGSA